MAQAEMAAVGECEVLVGSTAQVEPVRVGEYSGVTVGRVDPDTDEVTGGDRLPVDDSVAGRHPAAVQRRYCPAQHLVRGGRQVYLATLERSPLVGVVHQRQYAAADGMPPGLVAADHQPVAVGHQFGV